MTNNKNANMLSFTRLSFGFEDAALGERMNDEVPLEALTASFRNFMDARHSIDLPEHEDLQAQILLAQIAQESDE